MRCDLVGKENIIRISGTVGIAEFPACAKNDDDLLIATDKAMPATTARGKTIDSPWSVRRILIDLGGGET
jgi:predicted signal transduction protein with EAL and GGDEF domain